MEKITKPNDIFAAILQKPDITTSDLIASNINLANTQLLPMETYKQSPKVQELFTTESGEFDDLKFKKAYGEAAALYNNLDVDNTLANALEYDPLDFTAPLDSKKLDVRPVAYTEINPFKNLYGRTEVFSVDTSDQSLKELAQQGKVFDYNKKEWTNKTANDLGLFGTLFNETLVYATWDEDGYSIDPITNRQVAHKKGEWKFDPNGNLYVETLGDREIYGKQIVNPLDVITKEGTPINKIDFFDSDGKTKSVAGTTMKFVASIAPYLIPGFNVWYGGFNMALGLGSVLPTFYKAGEGLFLGDNTDGIETPLWKTMNSLEGFMSKYSARSVSEEGEKSMFTYEQLGSIVSDVFSQIYEQRAAASLSKLFYKTADTEKLNQLKNITDEALKGAIYAGKVTDKKQAIQIAERAFSKGLENSGNLMKQSKLAKSLSLGYMALSQSSNVYSDALAAGYDRRTAGFTSLLAASGQYALMMNNRMGDWFLDKTTGYTENESRAAIRKIANELLKDSKEAMKAFEVSKTSGKNALGNVFKNFKSKVDDLIFEPLSESEFAENIFKRAVIEGMEEVTEQAAIDMSKGVTDFLSYVGLTEKKGSFGGFSNVFSQDGLKEYLANFLGGAIGGPMFELERSVISPFFSKDGKVDLKTQSDLYSLVANGKAQEIYDYIDKNKSKFGSTTLSPEVTKLDEDNIVHLPTENITQADLIALNAKNGVKRIEELMYSENFGDSDEDLINKSIIDQIYINDIKKSGVDKFILSDTRELELDILKIKNELETLSSDPDKNKEKISELKSRLNESRQKHTDIITGKKSDYYHGLSLFTLNPKLHGSFISLSVDQYTKQKYDKDYHILTDSEKSAMDSEFKILKENSSENFKGKFKLMYDLFLKTNEDFSKVLKDYDSDGYASTRSGFYESLHTLKNDPNGVNFIKALERLNEVNQMILQNKATNTDSPETAKIHTIDSQTYLSLGKFLVEEGLLEQTLPEEDLLVLGETFINKVKEEYGIQESETEALIPIVNNLIAVNKAFKKLQEQVPDYKNFSITELLTLLSTQETTVGDTTYKVDLSADETYTLLNHFSNAVEINDTAALANDLYTKVVNGETITDEEKTRLGIDANLDPETINQRILEAYNHYNQEYQKLSSIKVGEKFDSKLDTLTSEYEADSSKTLELADEYKEVITNIIDQLGLPTKDLDPKLIQEAIDNYFNSAQDNYTKRLAEIEKIEDPQEKAIETLRAQMLAYAPKIKMKEIDDYVVSPRRKLLIRYANDLIKKGEALDSEVISELSQEQEALEDLFIQYNLEEEGQPYQNLLNEVEQIEKILSYDNIKINQLYDKLRQFEIDLFGASSPTSIFNILMENTKTFNDIVVNESDFVATPVQRIQIDKAIQTLQAVEGVLTAMSTTKWGVDNLYGMNIMLNKALEKNGEAPKYDFVESQAAHTIEKDLQSIKAKLEYFKHLSGKTSKSIIEIDAEIRKPVIDGVIKQYLDKNDPLSILNLSVTIDGKVHKLFSIEDLNIVQEIKDPEFKMIEIESRFYHNFHRIEGDLSEKLNSLFMNFLGENSKEEFIESILKSRKSNLTQDFKKFELFDLFSNLHYILAQDTKSFYSIYKNHLEKELSLQDKKAPLFSQMLVLKQTLAYIKRKDIVSHISSFLTNNLEDGTLNLNGVDELEAIVKNISNAQNFRVKNLIRVMGSGGTGKSSVIGNSILRLILDNKILGDIVEIITIAPTKKTLKTLNKEVKGESLENTKIEEMIVSDFIKTLLSEEGLTEYQKLLDVLNKETAQLPSTNAAWKPFIDSLNSKLNNEYFVAGEGKGAILIKENFFKSFVKQNSDDFTPRIIIGDEMSKITTLEHQILSYISESKNSEFDNYYTILMGDDLQGGVILGNQSFSTENILSPATFKMKNPIRSRNNVKNQNNIILELFAESVYSELVLKSGTALREITLGYHEQEGKFLTGDKLVSEITVKDLEKLDPNKEIVVITDSGEISPELRKDLSQVFGTKKIDVIKTSDVQGEEFEQVIVDNVNLSNNSGRVDTVKDFYTLFTRAKEVTLANIKTFLNVKNEKKASSTPYTIEKHLIDKAVADRLEYLKSLDLSLQPEIKKPVDIKEDEIEDLEDIIKDPDPLPKVPADPEIRTEEGVVKKDLNKALGYSFFNNLGLSRNKLGEEPPISEYLDKVIVYENPKDDSEITWTQLKELFADNLTGTDLFSIDLDTSNITLRRVIHEYIKFKNELLFTKDFKGTLFNSSVSIDKQWVLKKLSENNINKALISYGKIVNKNDIPQNSIYGIGTYFTIGGSKVFVTLAVSPDLSNPNVNSSAVNVDLLKEIYDRVDNSTNKEIEINKSSINLYRGVEIPKDRVADSTSVHKVLINQGTLTQKQIDEGFKRFEDVFPGAEISESKIKVFKDDIDAIKDELIKFSSYGMVKNSGTNKSEEEILKSFRFRPYIEVTYLERSIKHTRIIMLQNNKRSAADFWEEFKEVRAKNTGLEEAVKMNYLISHYRSWEIVFDYFKQVPLDKRKEISEDIAVGFMFHNSANALRWEPFKKIINSLADWDYNQNFDKWINSNTFINNIVTHNKEYKNQDQFKWGNVLHMMAGYLSTDESDNLEYLSFDNFMNNYSKEIYYNPILKSLGSEKEGAKLADLQEDNYKNFYMDVATESNKLLIDLTNFVKKKQSKKDNTPPDLSTTSSVANISFTFNGKPIIYQIPLIYTDSKILNQFKAVFNSFIHTKVIGLDSDVYEENGVLMFEDFNKTIDGVNTEFTLKEVLNLIFDQNRYKLDNGNYYPTNDLFGVITNAENSEIKCNIE